MNDTIIQCEEIYLNDMKRMKKDNLIAKDIMKNDILEAKKNGTQYSEFKKKYRPVGDDSSIKKLWNDIRSLEYDDWIILFNDSLEI
tara:strand:+ start:67 stop:324 length:258 start_codon:yes stop_codon:yes gene_type:complete